MLQLVVEECFTNGDTWLCIMHKAQTQSSNMKASEQSSHVLRSAMGLRRVKQLLGDDSPNKKRITDHEAPIGVLRGPWLFGSGLESAVHTVSQKKSTLIEPMDFLILCRLLSSGGLTPGDLGALVCLSEIL